MACFLNWIFTHLIDPIIQRLLDQLFEAGHALGEGLTSGVLDALNL